MGKCIWEASIQPDDHNEVTMDVGCMKVDDHLGSQGTLSQDTRSVPSTALVTTFITPFGLRSDLAYNLMIYLSCDLNDC